MQRLLASIQLLLTKNMATNKDQILTELTGIINESFETKKSYKGPELGIKRFINDMITESDSNPEVMKSLESIDSALNEGKSEASQIIPLLETAALFAKFIPGIVPIKESIENTINANVHEITMICLMESIQEDIKPLVKPYWDALMESGSMLSRAQLEEVLEPCAPLNESAARMLQYIRSYKQEDAAASVHALNESSVEISEKDQTKAELLSKMKDYVDSKLAEAEQPKRKSYRDINNDIRLLETIQNLKGIENPHLQSMLSLYEQALNDGCREEVIYETFLQRLHESEEFNYYNDLSKAEEDMRKRIMTHKESIDLTKVLEYLANDATWSYLLPIVEDVVVEYAENPNAINRSVLTNHLRMYDSCPYVRDIIGVANLDNSKDGNLLREAEQQLIQQRAHIEDVYSPIQYIKENECVFNVEDQFYVKKGHNVARLDKKSISGLSESFLALAKIINMPNVAVNEAQDCIEYVSESGNLVKIQEGKVMVGDNMETPTTLKNLSEMHMKYPSGTDIDFLTTAFLCENFNNIAKIDFVKKVVMNESDSKSLDLFKVKKNLYIAAHDNINEEHTFYRNVKPMQVKNIMNEHFGIQVSNLFENLLPNQDKLMNGINEIKQEYENKIYSLLEMKAKMSNALSKATSETATKIEQAISDITREINEAKAEYMKFQKKASLVEGVDPDERVDNVLDTAETSLDGTEPEDFSDVVSLNAEDYDGSDEDIESGSDDFASSDNTFEDLDGSDDFDELDFDLDGSEDFDDEYTSSDGDDMTSRIDDEFSTSPEIDDTDELSQRDDYNLDSKFNADNDEYTDEELDHEDEDIAEDVEDEEADGITDIDTDLTPDAEDDPFGADADEFDQEIDEPEVEDNIAGNEDTEEVADDADLDYASFKIVKIDFDVNVRTGERKNTGKAIVVVPMVDGEGNKTSETKNIDFYVTEIQGTKGVVLDSEGITLEMYNAVCDAIKKSADFQDVEPEAKAEEDTDEITSVEVTDEEPIEDEHIANGEEDTIDLSDEPEEDVNDDVFDSGSDETTVLTMDDNIEPHGIEIPEITDGEEDPVEDGDDELKGLFDDPEEGAVDAIPESKKAEGNKLNESEEDIEVEDEEDDIDPEGVVRSDLDISTEQDDPIAVIKETLDAFVEQGGDCEVGEINDYDVDGVDVSSIQAKIGSNDYTFFTLYEDIYCALTDDFDAYSQTKEDLEEWCSLEEDESDEAPMCANVEIAEGDTQSWIDFVTDIIATETGDDVEFEARDIEDGEEQVEEPVDEAVKVKVNPKKN